MEIINNILFTVVGGLIIILFTPLLFQKNDGVYRIFKGLNYSGVWFLKMFFKKQKSFRIKVILYKSCEVKTAGVQKIFGIGDLFHHINSDRFGFIYEGNKEYGIYSYQYRNGERIPEVRYGTVESGETFCIEFPNSIVNKYKLGRYLYPYFEQDGISEKGAPHTMKMRLEFDNLKYDYSYRECKYNSFILEN